MVIDERNQEKSDANIKPGSKVGEKIFLCQRFSIKVLVINNPTSPCKGKVVEKPKTRNRSRGHPDNKLLGEEATWGVQQKMSGRCFAELHYNQATWTETSSSSRICSSLNWHSPTTKATRWSYFEKNSKWFPKKTSLYSYEAFPSQRGLKDQMVETLAYLEKRKTFWRQTAASAKSKWIDDLFVCNL